MGTAQTEPTAAERARTVVALADEATLSTLAVEPAGTPFGSLVAFALDGAGRPVLSLSGLAEHTRNLDADPRASVMVVEPLEGGDGLARGRVTLLGTCDRIPEGEHDEARSLYLAAHPHAFYVDFADFGFFRLSVEQVRWVGGFGRMDWVDAASYGAATPDPLAGELAASAVEHMNTDHPDALMLMVQHMGGRPDATTAEVVAIDRYGFTASAHTPTGVERVRLAFDEPVDTTDALRDAMVRLTQQARAAVDA
jgi:putative heme iron utilization protein